MIDNTVEILAKCIRENEIWTYEEKFHGLDIIRTGDDETCNVFLGDVIGETGEHYSFYDEFLINIPVKIRTFGEEIGVCPSFFLTLNCS